ncbi:hypothetical protein TWF102_000215 [Orbilia oligospora]|uniref:Uncharacterized protein n=1 Tax=Orbilia oligospora TaxID=2813651 RepID=A0A7C8JH86_ORBOL|nr:hypothetical protein TWF102_000215 [Orbilia oligospora]KAF3115316.1 hypothetical protein TWF103_011574 [Orbilia oligospora]KAF3116792.1 hypothetical protein TWF706_000017 [Orbilia oligospora]
MELDIPQVIGPEYYRRGYETIEGDSVSTTGMNLTPKSPLNRNDAILMSPDHHRNPYKYFPMNQRLNQHSESTVPFVQHQRACNNVPLVTTNFVDVGECGKLVEQIIKGSWLELGHYDETLGLPYFSSEDIRIRTLTDEILELEVHVKLYGETKGVLQKEESISCRDIAIALLCESAGLFGLDSIKAITKIDGCGTIPIVDKPGIYQILLVKSTKEIRADIIELLKDQGPAENKSDLNYEGNKTPICSTPQAPIFLFLRSPDSSGRVCEKLYELSSQFV